jgi:DNA polymerase II small subunit
LKKDQLVKTFLEYNFNVAPDALDFLMELNVSEEYLRKLIHQIPKDLPVINRNVIENYQKNFDQQFKQPDMEEKASSEEQSINQKELNDRIISESEKDIPEKIMRLEQIERLSPKILVKLDIPDRSSDKPNIETFRQLFLNRYEKLSNILKTNISEQNSILRQILSDEEIPTDKSGILLGMVQDTRVLHTNKFVIQLENPESNILTRCVMVQDSESFPEYREILRDTVVGIEGVLPKNYQGGEITAFWGRDVIRPSFNPIDFKSTTESYKILFISDIHFGSNNFIRSIFAKLIQFLSLQKLTPQNEELASKIGTLMIVGDLIEGIGLFPDQKDEIVYHSLQSQYEGLSILLQEIPKDIEIIIIPGEHDATQIPNPQPAIDKQIGKTLLTLPNLRNHGNPLRLTIEDMTILAFHGQGHEILFEKHFDADPLNPIRGIKDLLEYRHLFPEYGSFNPITPFKRDYLVINEIPNVVVSGHFHQAHFEEYKGVKILTCGSFQREENKKTKDIINASLGRFPILDTQTGQVEMIDLKEIK